MVPRALHDSATVVSVPPVMYPSAMPSSRSGCALVLAVALAALTSCGSTHLLTRWQDPATTQIRFTKVLSLCFTKDPSLRDAAEGELCRHMPLTECKPAYFAIPESIVSEVDDAKALILKEGFDGAVVMRVLDRRERVTYTPPSYGPSFWGYYRYARPLAYDPGSYRTDDVVLVETSIYSLTSDKLLWVGTTETLNPKSLPDVVDDIAKAVRGELLRRDLIPPS
jgi:hypothetical protein